MPNILVNFDIRGDLCKSVTIMSANLCFSNMRVTRFYKRKIDNRLDMYQPYLKPFSTFSHSYRVHALGIQINIPTTVTPWHAIVSVSPPLLSKRILRPSLLAPRSASFESLSHRLFPLDPAVLQLIPQGYLT
jgi:hypothetical protein